MSSATSLPQYEHFIAGGAVPPSGSQYLPTEDPYSGQVWAHSARGNAADAAAAVQAADRAFREGAWPALTPSERGRMLWRLADLITANAERLALIERRDNGMLALVLVYN